MDKSIFREYDIRGAYPAQINEKIIAQIAIVLPSIFKRGKIIVGHDARLSSPSLYRSLLRSLSSGNRALEIISLGLMTTPMLYFLVNHLQALGGIMVTASHNPKNHNGLKIVGRKARPISGFDVFAYLGRAPGTGTGHYGQ